MLISAYQWGDISIDQIEQAIHKTRGAIFHHYKTKDELFTNTILYFFSCCQIENNSNEGFFQTILSVLVNKYKVKNPELALFNIIVQAFLKEEPLVKYFFSDINPNEIQKEIESAGSAFIKILMT